MKHQLTLFIIFFFICVNVAAYDGAGLQIHPSSTFKIKGCKSPTDCSFSGDQVISGTYEIGDFDIDDPECISTKKERCISLRLYPNNWQILPHFDGSAPDYILVKNPTKAATAIVGKRIINQLILNKIPGASGRVTVVLSDFEMGLSCDSTGYANAKIKRVNKKSPPSIKAVNPDGC